MLWVKLSTHITDHARFLEAGSAARDLWTWGMLYAGAHETDGELPMVAVMTSSWGRGDRGNVKLALTLVRVGLWERTDSGFRILRWAEQGNQTKAQIVAEREAARERMASRRSGNVRANDGRTSVDVPTSTSTSLSSGSRLVSPEPPQDGITDGPPAWWQSALDTVEMATGEKVDPASTWLRYDGHRDGKGRAPSRKDAMYWVTTVVVREMKQEREEAHRRNERDGERTKALQAARSGPEVKALPSVTPLIRERAGWERDAATPEESAEAAAKLQRLLGGVGGGR